MKHQFGGTWTEAKLACLEKYLQAYMRIFSANTKARYLHPIYVDAFAGCGYRQDSDLPLFEGLDDPEWNPFRKGSARIALELEPPFAEYIFIERDAAWCRELEALKDEFELRGRRIHIIQGDANDVLPEWLAQRNWERDRAAVFLDPYGMNVEWSLIESLAKTEAVDMWLLFPLSMGVNRLLTRDREPPPGFSQRLDRLFGTNAWLEAFYSLEREQTLFGEYEHVQKNANYSSIARYIVERLESVFPSVAQRPLPLYNSCH